MARSGKKRETPPAGKRPIEQYDHKGKQRKNNPPVGLVTEATDRDAPRRRYAYDPHLDPALVWAGKAERTAFEVPTVSLHVHERIDPKTIIEVVRRRNGTPAPVQGSLFGSSQEPAAPRGHRLLPARPRLVEPAVSRTPSDLADLIHAAAQVP